MSAAFRLLFPQICLRNYWFFFIALLWVFNRYINYFSYLGDNVDEVFVGL